MNLKDRFYYTRENIIWWYDTHRESFWNVVLCIFIALAVGGVQEYRIHLMRESHARTLNNQRDSMQREIISLQFELGREKHNNLPLEERMRREELLRIWEESPRPR